MPRSARPVELPWRRLLTITVGGVTCALLVLAAGWLVRWAVLGSDETGTRARAETVLIETFDSMTRSLRETSAAVADPALVRAAGAGDVTAARRLLTQAGAAVRAEGVAGSALTVYSLEGEPLAWAGRPSNLPPARLQGDEAWFLITGPSGLHLVYIRPVDTEGTRSGSVAVERPLTLRDVDVRRGAERLQLDEATAFRVETWIAPATIELPRASEEPDTGQIEVVAPTGEPLLWARVAASDLRAIRARWASAARSVAVGVLAFTLLLLTGPLLDWRNGARSPWPYVWGTGGVSAAIIAARVLLRSMSPTDASDAPVFSDVAYGSPLLSPLLTSPFDFVLTAIAACALVLVGLSAVDARRLHVRRRRRAVDSGRRRALFASTQLIGGGVLALVCLGHQALLRDTITHTSLDVTHFSLHPWDTARLALQLGLVLAHAAAAGMAVLALRAGLQHWRVPRGDWQLRLLLPAAWMLPLVAWQLVTVAPAADALPPLVAAATAVALALATTRLVARYRRGSQAFRLVLLTVPFVAPAFGFYPSVVQLAHQAKEAFVEVSYAPLVLNQRPDVQDRLQQSLLEIDGFADLVQLAATPTPGDLSVTDRAFSVWRRTALARYPVTSSVEIYGPDGTLVSRFAFNLPEDLSAAPRSEEQSCDWDPYEEVAPFFAEDRRVLHAGRAFCGAPGDPTPLGSIVVHAMPDDYGNLPFISSRNPYVDLLVPSDPLRREGLSGRDVEFAVYGWSRAPLYPVAATAWPLPDDVFARVEDSRDPIWARLARGDDQYDVYLLNDRGGIYALGIPVISLLGHLVNLAELTVLGLLVYVAFLAASAVFNWLGHREMSAPALLREIRASFYRKLFLAFVAAVFVPVVALVLVTRNYVAAQMEANVEQEAVRTASAAARVVADLVAPRAAAQGLDVDDNLMVWVSRLIDQDVNIFVDARLLATSERNVFASGLLPTRLDADVHHALALRNEAAIVTREQVGLAEYLVAATPLSVRPGGILTVPLTSRQRQIDAQLDTLDRRALLAALIFILGGAGLGYSMAERISDPVSRLTRATGRIARGDLDARIAATSSDELRRLVEAFNSMAGDLKRQRAELERTHRLEAWAEMARQVAHEIKNPLTPIQLNAEHLRRVHQDRGEPLGSVLQECVATILAQVTLLRQIASEFSSFASSPTARPTELDVAVLLREILDPYRPGLEGRIRLILDVPQPLPPVFADRVLVARSVTNLVENAVHAMPGTGALTVRAEAKGDRVRVSVSDTGAGMDEEALARAFEPYFSTKAAGTGLGLPIAKRNVELNGGTMTVTSAPGQGTTVEITLPAVASTAAGARGAPTRPQTTPG